jgi:hypothetical protein
MIVGAAVGLLAAGVLLSRSSPRRSGTTFRDAAYKTYICTLRAKSNKVLLRRPRHGKASSVGILTLYTECNYRPAVAAKMSGIITVFPGRTFGTGGKFYDVGPYKAGIPKPGVRITFKVKLPKPALTGLKKGRLVNGSFLLNLPAHCQPVGSSGCLGKAAGLDIRQIKGVK